MIHDTASAKTIFIIVGKIMVCAKQRLILLYLFLYWGTDQDNSREQ